MRVTDGDGADLADALVLVVAGGANWRGYHLHRGVARLAVSTAADLMVLAKGYETARRAGVTSSCSIALQPARRVRLRLELPAPLPEAVQLALRLRPQPGFDARAWVLLDDGRDLPLQSLLVDEATAAADGGLELPVRWPGEHALEGRIEIAGRDAGVLSRLQPDRLTLPAAPATTVRIDQQELDQLLQSLPK